MVRVAGDATARLRAAGFDVVGVRDGATYVVVDSLDQARLTALGRPPRWCARPRRRPTSCGSAPRRPSSIRSFDDPARGVRAYLDSMARANPRVRLDTLGLTLERRPILAVKVGAADDAAARPNVLFMATYHAREWAATEMALRLARHLAQPAGGDPRLDSLVARRDVWVLPVANPDGYQYAFDVERLWRKNRRPLGVINGQAEFGVDLNRNHGERWGQDDQGSSPNPRVGGVPRPRARLGAGGAGDRAVPRAAPAGGLGELPHLRGMVLFPPGNRFGLVPGDLGIYRTLAGTDERPAVLDRLPGSDRGYYRPTYGWQLYVTNGEYTDWAYGRLGTIAFTPEITSGFGTNGFYDFDFPTTRRCSSACSATTCPSRSTCSRARPTRCAACRPRPGSRSERLALESVFPRVRVRVPGSVATAGRGGERRRRAAPRAASTRSATAAIPSAR